MVCPQRTVPRPGIPPESGRSAGMLRQLECASTGAEYYLNPSTRPSGAFGCSRCVLCGLTLWLEREVLHCCGKRLKENRRAKPLSPVRHQAVQLGASQWVNDTSVLGGRRNASATSHKSGVSPPNRQNAVPARWYRVATVSLRSILRA